MLRITSEHRLIMIPDLMWPLNFLTGLNQNALGVFLPLIVEELGYTSYHANLYSVPIYVVGAVGEFSPM